MSPPRRKTDGILIPWQLVAVVVTILAGVIWINVQIAVQGRDLATTKEKVDLLFKIEMERHPRIGPRRGEE
jgi:hypothetical protein